MSDVEVVAPIRHAWPAVGAVALGIFALMTSELLPVGLLTPVAATLGVSEGTAGLMVTVPGLVAAVSAPVVTVAAARVDRRTLLAALIGVMGAAAFLSAAAPTFAVLLAARLAVGVSVGGFWAIAAGLAPRLVAPERVPRATALIFGGVSTAAVLGTPAGTFLGERLGWRASFAAVGLLALVALAGLLAFVPRLPSSRSADVRELPRLWRRNPGVRAGVLITALLVTGQFTAYTYLRPILQELAGVQGGHIGAVLAAYGLAGIAGNFLIGTRAARDPRRVLTGIAAALTAVLAAFVLAGPAAGVVLTVLWGLAYGGVSIGLQTWMMRAAPDDAEPASGLFVAAFNASIALGAAIGGAASDGLGTTGVPWIAAALTLLTAVAVGLTGRRK